MNRAKAVLVACIVLATETGGAAAFEFDCSKPEPSGGGAAYYATCTPPTGGAVGKEASTRSGQELMQEAAAARRDGSRVLFRQKLTAARRLLSLDPVANAILLEVIDSQLKRDSESEESRPAPTVRAASPPTSNVEAELDPSDPKPRAISQTKPGGIRNTYTAFQSEPCETFDSAGSVVGLCDAESEAKLRSEWTSAYIVWEKRMQAKGLIKGGSLEGNIVLPPMPAGDRAVTAVTLAQPVQSVRASATQSSPACVVDPGWTGQITRTFDSGRPLTFKTGETCTVSGSQEPCTDVERYLMVGEYVALVNNQNDRRGACPLGQLPINMLPKATSMTSVNDRAECVQDYDWTSGIVSPFDGDRFSYNPSTSICQSLSTGKPCEEKSSDFMKSAWNSKVAAQKTRYPDCPLGFRPRRSLQQVSTIVPALVSSGISGISTARPQPRARVAGKNLIRVDPALLMRGGGRKKVGSIPRVKTRTQGASVYEPVSEAPAMEPDEAYQGPSVGDVASGLFSAAAAILPVAAAIAGVRGRTTSAPTVTYRSSTPSYRTNTYPQGPERSRSGISGSTR